MSAESPVDPAVYSAATAKVLAAAFHVPADQIVSGTLRGSIWHALPPTLVMDPPSTISAFSWYPDEGWCFADGPFNFADPDDSAICWTEWELASRTPSPVAFGEWALIACQEESTGRLLEQAAQRLREMADAAEKEMAANPYWGGDPGNFAAGIDNATGGAAGELAALFNPAMARDLAGLIVGVPERHRMSPAMKPAWWPSKTCRSCGGTGEVYGGTGIDGHIWTGEFCGCESRFCDCGVADECPEVKHAEAMARSVLGKEATS